MSQEILVLWHRVFMSLSINRSTSSSNQLYLYAARRRGGLRIPKHKVNTSFRQQFNSNTQLLTSIQFVGDRDDLAGQDLVVLSSYWLLDLRISHQLSQAGVSLFGSIENVFNADYEEVRGYTTRGRNLSLGVSYAF